MILTDSCSKNETQTEGLNVFKLQAIVIGEEVPSGIYWWEELWLDGWWQTECISVGLRNWVRSLCLMVSMITDRLGPPSSERKPRIVTIEYCYGTWEASTGVLHFGHLSLRQ